MKNLDEIRAQCTAMLNITDDLPMSKAGSDRLCRAVLELLPIVEAAIMADTSTGLTACEYLDAQTNLRWAVAAFRAANREGETKA